MKNQSSFMNSYYRKLDIYSRVFILNYGDLSHLESTVVRLKHDDLVLNNLLALKATTLKDGYLDLSDTKLILASFSLKWLHAIFKHVVLELLAMDSKMRINGKLISKVKAQLTDKEWAVVLSTPSLTIKTRISELLTEYSIVQIIDGVMATYFDGLHQNLVSQMQGRFKVSTYQNTFTDYLDKSMLDNLVELTIARVLPVTNQVIQQFKSKENN